MNFFKIKSLHETRDILSNLTNTFRPEEEVVSLTSSFGRTVSESILSKVNIPSFDRSTVDGYAVRSRDVNGASESIPSILTIKGTSVMGEAMTQSVKLGEAIYIPTGGMLPEGADGVVMIEHTELMSTDRVLIHRPISFGENIIYKGDDLKLNQSIVDKGKSLSAYDIGLLAGAGVGKVSVYKPLKVAIISTGDEIVDCDTDIQLGQIRDINGYSLMGACEALGSVVVYKVIIEDDMLALKSGVDKALELADVVLLSGGSSVGTRDFTHKVIESYENSKLWIHGISMKPGKPTIVGQVGEKLIFGLPGHPTASAMVFEVLVKPYMQALHNMNVSLLGVKAKLAESVHSSPGKDTFIMAMVSELDDELIAKPILGKSGLISLMTRASGYIHIRSDQEGVVKDDIVKVFMFGKGD